VRKQKNHWIIGIVIIGSLIIAAIVGVLVIRAKNKRYALREWADYK